MFINYFLFLLCFIFKTMAPADSSNIPLPAEKLCRGTAYIQNMEADGGFTFWSELRPENGGRSTIVRHGPSGEKVDVTPADFNVSTSVHEYGGGAFTVVDGRIFASNGKDGALYLIEPGVPPRRLTEEKTPTSETRFADLHLSPQGLVAVAEYHAPDKVENFLALVNTTTGSYTRLASGYDFYASPALSADGKKIAWICWNHPNMPWTKSELWIADLSKDGVLKNAQQICGFGSESIFQPQWSKEGILYFVTDRDKGWWNLHRYLNGQVENVCPMEAEVAEPLWVFGLSTYAFLGDKIVFTYNTEGKTHLGILNPNTKHFQEIPREGVYLHQVRSTGHSVRFLEQFTNKGEALFELAENSTEPKQLYQSPPPPLAQEMISTPVHISFPSNGRTAFGFYYPPMHQKPGQKPPLLVVLHGGPTAQAKASFKLEHQFWISRGFALLDVNYGGSTGYGRAYRELLGGQWGVVDVEDCVNGARFLVEQGLVDGNKLAIRGKSAGGYTTLAALAFHDTFHAGASHFGIADITALMEDTHKFEKYYAMELIGKYPEERELWEKRSPIHSVDKIKAPLILFQGENDRVVPKNQAEMIFAALHAQGLFVKLHIFPGEGHGFKQECHIIECLTLEAEFYDQVFSAD